MRVLVVGGGGREHALCWALARSDSVEEVVATPGNPGIEGVARCLPVDPKDPAAVARLADDVDADLVLPGSEDTLVRGVVDAVQARGRHAFGPVAAAAKLEGSKAWMKEVAAAAGVPTARHGTFSAADQDAAFVFLESLDGLYVVKTDGLAAGKGVIVTESIAEARDAVRAYLSGDAFGDAGRTLVIEEGMRGPELSLLVVCNGDVDAAVPLAPAQDFKRVHDDDAGPNTGGMGAYSPVPIAGDDIVEEVMSRSVRPTLHELRARGLEYRGILYAGLMLTVDGPKLVEYNVRFGDPECQVVVPRLETDLGELCLAAARGEALPEVRCVSESWVTLVLASEGYPASPRTGDVIDGLDEASGLPGVVLFHAGTARASDGRLVTNGGRVLDVTASAESLSEARDRAYRAAAQISWPGVHFRHDIAAAAAVPT
ncbi:MAG: phosphoribosylamine--glycine ligase [Acidimicrobiia bacterium]